MFELLYLLAIPSVLLLTLCASELIYLKIKKTLTECQSRRKANGKVVPPTKATNLSVYGN